MSQDDTNLKCGLKTKIIVCLFVCFFCSCVERGRGQGEVGVGLRKQGLVATRGGGQTLNDCMLIAICNTTDALCNDISQHRG